MGTDRTLYRKWEKQAGIEYGTHKRICQLHFNDGCFATNEENLDSKGTPRKGLCLKKTAIPTIFTFGPPKTSRRLKVELSAETDLELEGPDEILPDVEHDAEDDDDDEDLGSDSSDYSPPKKQVKRGNDDEKSSPKKKKKRGKKRKKNSQKKKKKKKKKK